MSNYQYTSDILEDVLERCGEKADTSSDFYNIALRYINRAYLGICNGNSVVDPLTVIDWFWAKKTQPLILERVINTGTVSVTQNSADITFSIAPSNSLGNVNIATFNRYLFKTDDHDDVFAISSHTGGATAAVLDSIYTGPTNKAAKYKVFKVEYPLASDVVRVISPIEIFQSTEKISYLELERFEALYPLREIEAGEPNRFTLIQNQLLRFNGYGDINDYFRVDYTYIYEPALLTNAANEEPIIPRRFRGILSDIVAYYIFLDKNDDRADSAFLGAKAVYETMKQDNDRWLTKIGKDVGKIKTRPHIISYSSKNYYGRG